MNYIEITDAKKSKCPNCNSIFMIYNDHERLIRNASVIYIDTEKNMTEIKCKKCKGIIVIDRI